MPKTVELTVEIEVQKVSCPGVWLCQDGRVSLTIFTLGTSYQTCLLPPVFPLTFKDVFYFRKKFQNGCAVNNMCCLLKNETVYCELVQWCSDCTTDECVMLAQYLGSLSDVLFPSNLCSNDGVDLLMRRTKDYPGILSPKIEIATKVRIDEIRDDCQLFKGKMKECQCDKGQKQDAMRQKQVCHSAQYHRSRCHKSRRPSSRSRSRSSKSVTSKSDCSLKAPTSPHPNSRASLSARHNCDYSVYSADVSHATWQPTSDSQSNSNLTKSNKEDLYIPPSNRLKKLQLESRYVDVDREYEARARRQAHCQISPCVCEICKKYHEMFHISRCS